VDKRGDGSGGLLSDSAREQMLPASRPAPKQAEPERKSVALERLTGWEMGLSDSGAGAEDEERAEIHLLDPEDQNRAKLRHRPPQIGKIRGP
jgi:hypothetical protein